MIKNERQYKITRANAEKFRKALDEIESDAALDPLLRQVHTGALESQLRELSEEIVEYEALAAGKTNVLNVRSFDEFPTALIQARIAVGLTQKELATRLGLKEQQIQQYEATEYASASFSRLNEIVRALGVQVEEQVYIGTHSSVPGREAR